MADQPISIEEFAAKIRERRPDLGHVPAIELVSKTLAAAPQLRQFVQLDSLGDSRRAASAAEFEANKPAQTGWTAARELGIHLAEGAKHLINPTPDEIAGTIKTVGGGIMDAVRGRGTAKLQSAIMAPAQPVGAAISDYKAGNTDAMAGDMGDIITQTLPAVEGGVQALKGLGRSVKSLGSPLASKWVTETLTAPRINTLLEVPARARNPVLDPGRRIIEDGIVATSQRGLLTKMQANKAKIGPQLEHKLTMEGAGTRNNAEAHIDRAIDAARKDIDLSTVEGFDKGLDKLKAGLQDFVTKEFGADTDLSNLTQLQTQRLKSHLGHHGTKFRGIPAETGLNQVRLDIYHDLARDISVNVPSSTDLLHAWGDYEIGINALKDKVLRTKYGLTGPHTTLNFKGLNLPKFTLARTGAGQLFRAPLDPTPIPPYSDGIARAVGGDILMNQGSAEPPTRVGSGLAQGGEMHFDTRNRPGVRGLLGPGGGREVPINYPVEPIAQPPRVDFRSAKLPTSPPLGMADPIISRVSDNLAGTPGSAADYGRLREVVRDIASVYKSRQIDAMAPIQHLVEVAGGNQHILVELMSRPEGLNVVQQLIRAQKRSAVRDVLYWQQQLKEVTQRQLRRSSAAVPPPTGPER